MNSLEAVEELKTVLRTNPGTKNYADILIKELIEPIEKDLKLKNIPKE